MLTKREIWCPCLYALLIAVLLTLINVCSYRLGHTTITNTAEQKITFYVPPISLIANRLPEYLIYLIGILCCIFVAGRNLLHLNEKVKAAERNLNSSYSFTDNSNDQSDDAAESDSVTQRHRLASWRSHFNMSASVLDSGSGSISTSPPTRIWKNPLQRNPLLQGAWTSTWVALCALAVVAVVPVQFDGLQQLGKDCIEVHRNGDTIGDLWAHGFDVFINRVHNGPSPIVDDKEKNDEHDVAMFEGEEKLGADNRAVNETIDLESGELIEMPFTESIEEPSTESIEFQSQVSIETDLGPERNTGLLPLRRRLGMYDWDWLDVGAVDPSNSNAAVYCPDPATLIATATTLIHAMAALTFFFAAFAAMTLLIIWLLLHRRGGSGVLFKLLVTLAPWIRPLQPLKRAVIRHGTLIDWYGIVQRFAVGCILLYIASLSSDLHRIRSLVTR